MGGAELRRIARRVVAALLIATPLVAQEPVSIFDGESLDGWTIHGTERWYVEDGELVCESGPDAAYGYLRTDAMYKDFELTLEFRQEADGNSGVFFRSTLDGVIITGFQTEVAPPGLYSGGIYESYGRGWLVQPEPEKDHALRMGDWNEMKIRVVGSRVTTWLNGTEMIDLTDEKIGEATGHIALQIHDGAGSRCGGGTYGWLSTKAPIPLDPQHLRARDQSSRKRPFDRADELRELEGLHDYLDRAKSRGLHEELVFRNRTPARNRNDRDLGVQHPDGRDHLVPIQTGHVDVGENQIGRAFPEEPQAFCTVERLVDLVAFPD